MLFSVRDIDVLRLLCWCQNIKPNSLNGVSTKEERENLMTMGFIKTHERSGTLLLTNKGRAFVELLLTELSPACVFPTMMPPLSGAFDYPNWC